jgi:hypothetical protein
MVVVQWTAIVRWSKDFWRLRIQEGIVDISGNNNNSGGGVTNKPDRMDQSIGSSPGGFDRSWQLYVRIMARQTSLSQRIHFSK